MVTGMTDPDKQLEEDRERLAHLEEEIQEVRHHTPEWQEEHERHFIDSGPRDEDQPVDDTIAPPG